MGYFIMCHIFLWSKTKVSVPSSSPVSPLYCVLVGDGNIGLPPEPVLGDGVENIDARGNGLIVL